jgi:hypothetical protein
MDIFKIDGVKLWLIIAILLFVITWLAWINFVGMNILEIQSIMIEQKNEEICRLTVVLNEVTGEERGCEIPKTIFPDHILHP